MVRVRVRSGSGLKAVGLQDGDKAGVKAIESFTNTANGN